MIVVPTLTIDGFESNPINQMIKLFEYYQTCEHSQTNTFRHKIISLKKTLLLSSDPDILRTQIENDIRELYSSCFDRVIPDIRIDENKDDAKVNIFIKITCVKNEKEYSLDWNFVTVDGVIIDINSALYQSYYKHLSKGD